MQEPRLTLPASLRSQVLQQLRLSSTPPRQPPAPEVHPPLELLLALHRGHIQEPWQSEVRTHSLACIQCREELSRALLREARNGRSPVWGSLQQEEEQDQDSLAPDSETVAGLLEPLRQKEQGPSLEESHQEESHRFKTEDDMPQGLAFREQEEGEERDRQTTPPPKEASQARLDNLQGYDALGQNAPPPKEVPLAGAAVIPFAAPSRERQEKKEPEKRASFERKGGRHWLGLALAAGLVGVFFGLGRLAITPPSTIPRAAWKNAPSWTQDQGQIKGPGALLHPAPREQALLLVGTLASSAEKAPLRQTRHPPLIQRLRQNSIVRPGAALYFAFYLPKAGYPYLFQVDQEQPPQMIFPRPQTTLKRSPGGKVSAIQQEDGLPLRYRLGEEKGRLRFVLLQSHQPLSPGTLKKLLAHQSWSSPQGLSFSHLGLGRIFVGTFSLRVQKGGAR